MQDDLERNLLRLRQRRVSCRDEVHVRSLDDAAWETRVPCGRRPVVTLTACLCSAGQNRAQDHRISAAGNRLGDVSGGVDVAVGKHVHVAAAGLVEVVAASGSDVGNGGCHRHIDAHGLGVGINARAHDDAGSASTHQVQCGGVISHAASDNWRIDGTDELLQVQRLPALLDVLRGNQRALDEQDLSTRLDDHRCQFPRALRRNTHRHGHAGVTHLCDAL